MIMNYEKLETEDEYREALQRFLQLCETQKNEEETEELFLLIQLLGKYEQDNCSYI